MVGVEARLTAGRESDAEGASDRAEQRRANAIFDARDASGIGSETKKNLSRGDFLTTKDLEFS